MIKTKKFINTLLEEFEKEQAKEKFTNIIMERLDNLANKYNKSEVFHLTADEFLCYDDEGNYYGVLEFLNELDINSLEDELIQEVLNYFIKAMNEDDDKYPEELLERLFDDITK